MEKLAVIIPAAGSGTRLGSRLPKPFIPLGDKTILEWTISRFLEIDCLLQVIVATSIDYIPTLERIFAKYSLSHSHIDFKVVKGGSERQNSINNALGIVHEEIELVAVHDAVRPFVSLENILQCIAVAKEVGGAALGVPAKDTIKKIDKEGVILETPNREQLWQAQTPQIFQKALLKKAYNIAIQEGFLGTDDASLVEHIGGIVKMVEGDRRNLKITYPIDLKIAELLIHEKQ